MRRQFFWLMLVLVLPWLVACGAGTPTGSVPTTDAYGGEAAVTDDGVDRSRLARELYFYNWSDYINPEILTQFEEEYGVRVIVDIFDSNEDMIAKIRAGNSGYDVVAPSDYAVQIMALDDLVAPLDQALVPNMQYLDPGLLNKYFDPDNAISLPYLYGLTGIAYNRTFFPEGITSWSVLFDPAQLPDLRGRFSMLDDERETPGAVLKYLGASINATDPAILAQVEALLIAQKPFLASYNSSDVNRRLASEEFILAHAWSGAAMQARTGLGDEFSGNPNIEFVIPDEGGAIWMDNLVILRESPNAYTAHVFINFLLRPDVAAANADYVGYLTPNEAAIPLLSQEVRDLYAAGFAPDDAMLERLEWIERDEDTVVFTELWTRVKGQ